jgi:hypothetical protein
MVKRRCPGTNASGEPCGAPPIRDSRYCYFHDPELAEAREQARHLGRARQRSDASLATIYGFTTLATAEGKAQYLDIAAHDALALDNSVPRVRAMGGLVQISIKVDEHAGILDRLAALEAATARHEQDHRSLFDLGEFDDPVQGSPARDEP